MCGQVILVILRVLSGVGVGGSVPSVWTMVTEVLPLHRRGFYLTFVAWCVDQRKEAGSDADQQLTTCIVAGGGWWGCSSPPRWRGS